jgi:glycosyltransferase involved in cell wall biosynthesis
MHNEITVIIPSTRKSFFDAVHSVRSQTVSVNEILVIDDSASQDLASKEPTVRIVRTGGRKGVSYARNLGLKEAEGNWIAFLDDDDIWLPNKIELQLAFMKRENLNVSFTNCIELPRGSVRNNPNYSRNCSPLSQIYDKGFRLRSRYYLGFSSVLIDQNYKSRFEFDNSLSNREDLTVIQDLWELGARIDVLQTPLCVIFTDHIRGLGRLKFRQEIAWLKYLGVHAKGTLVRYIFILLRNICYLYFRKLIRVTK